MATIEDSKRLTEVARQVREPLWSEYARYCELRSQGRRPQALTALDSFLTAATSWPVDERRAFARWLLGESQHFVNSRLALPEPLLRRLIEPALVEWCSAAPESAEPHMWLGVIGYDDPLQHLRLALELDPGCELARTSLLQRIIDSVQYNQHELPDLYIHDPRDDIAQLNFASDLLSRTNAQDWEQKIVVLRRLAEDWLAKHPNEGDFAAF